MDGMKIAKVLIQRQGETLQHLALRMDPESAQDLLSRWLSPEINVLENGCKVIFNDILAVESLDGTKYGFLRSTIAAISFKNELTEGTPAHV